MASITINEGPYRGEWPIDFGDSFTIGEWRVIKKVSGYLPLTIEEGFSNLDPDLIVALTVVALVRNGKVRSENALDAARRMDDMALDGSGIVVDFGGAEDGDDADPPTTTETEQPEPSSGGSSTPTADLSESDLSPIGHPV